MVGDELRKCQDLHLASKWQKNRLEVESVTSHLSKNKVLNKYFCLEEKEDWLLPHQVQQPSDNSSKCRGSWAALSNGLCRAEISLSHHKQLSEVDKGLSVGTFKEEKFYQATVGGNRKTFLWIFPGYSWLTPVRYPIKASDGKNWWARPVCNSRGSRRLTLKTILVCPAKLRIINQVAKVQMPSLGWNVFQDTQPND